MTEPLLESVDTSTPARSGRPAVGVEPAASNGARIEADQDVPPRTPRWVKAFGIMAIVLLLALAGMHLTGTTPSHAPGSGGIEHGVHAP